MTTLYRQDTHTPCGELSEAAAWCAVSRWPNKYFYYIGEPEIRDVNEFYPDFLKPGGTD